MFALVTEPILNSECLTQTEVVMRFAMTVACVPLFTAVLVGQDAPMPKEFRGRWAGNRAQCGRGTDSESSLIVYADRVRFYGGWGPVYGVKRISDREIEFEAELSGEEGGVGHSTIRFRLSDNGRTLTTTILNTPPPHPEYARVRCD
jgi:hypothetical protein